MAGLYKRGKTYYAMYYTGGTKHRVSLNTASLQIGKEKIRQIESSLFKGDDKPLPTKTQLEKILNEYVKQIEIRFFTLTQIDEQLKALENHPQIRAVVAMLIYAGLRREELLWLPRPKRYT